jgi:hypothetical protein
VSNNRLKFDGLQEFKKSLRDLPYALHGEAENEVDAEANQAALEIRSAYKRRSGALMEGVYVERVERSRFFAGRRVVSKSPLAMIYENGSQVRHTELGYNRGRMPPAHVFIPAMIRHRKEMYDRLRDVMRRHGLKVIG